MLLGGILLLAGACAPSDTAIRLEHPWRAMQTFAGVPGLDSPALWRDDRALWLAWPGPPDEPNLRLVALSGDSEAQPDAIRRLALGIRPTGVRLAALADRWSQLVWLEGRAEGGYALVGGTLGPSRQVERGPTDIADGPVLEFAAGTTPDGELLVLWSQTDGAETPVFATLIDGLGRPRAPVRLSPSGRFPALAFGPDDRLHAAWLEAGQGGVWSVRYLEAPRGPLRLFDALPGIMSTPVGVVRTGAGQMIDGLALGVDSRAVFLVWSLVVVNADGVHGAVSGLSFAQGAPAATRSLDFTALPAMLSVRWPVISDGPPLPDGVLLALSAGEPARPADRPLVVRLSREGILAFSPVLADSPAGSQAQGAIGPASLAHDAAGNLTLAWRVLRPDGTAALHVAARPAGR